MDEFKGEISVITLVSSDSRRVAFPLDKKGDSKFFKALEEDEEILGPIEVSFLSETLDKVVDYVMYNGSDGKKTFIKPLKHTYKLFDTWETKFFDISLFELLSLIKAALYFDLASLFEHSCISLIFQYIMDKLPHEMQETFSSLELPDDLAFAIKLFLPECSVCKKSTNFSRDCVFCKQTVCYKCLKISKPFLFQGGVKRFYCGCKYGCKYGCEYIGCLSEFQFPCDPSGFVLVYSVSRWITVHCAFMKDNIGREVFEDEKVKEFFFSIKGDDQEFTLLRYHHFVACDFGTHWNLRCSELQDIIVGKVETALAEEKRAFESGFTWSLLKLCGFKYAEIKELLFFRRALRDWKEDINTPWKEINNLTLS